MATHEATVKWILQDGEDFLKGRYSREHTWTFDGGAQVPASPAPSVVPVPFSNPDAVDPEEAFVASIASCHMLTYLFLAGKNGYQIKGYSDQAVGEMTPGDNGVPWVKLVTLHPKIDYVGEKIPDQEAIDQLHHDAHHHCYIANSVKTEIRVEA